MTQIKALIVSNYRDKVVARPEAEAIIGLKKKGIDIHVMSFEDAAYRARFEAEGIRYIPFHPEKKLHPPTIRYMRDLMKKEQYHVAHFFNSKASLNGIRAAKKLPTKIVLYRGFAGHIHWYDPTAYLKYLSPHVDKIMCITEAAANHIREQLFFDKSKAVVIHKGHHPSWYADVEKSDLTQLGIPKNAFTVVNVANVRPMKGIEYILKATYHIPTDFPIHFLFVGKGMDAPKIQTLIQNSPNKDKIHTLGFRDDALGIVKAADVFCLSSLWGESINKATIEAMSLGTTPVITRIAGNKILVNDGENGLTVPTRDEQALAKAFLELYQQPDWNKELALRAKEHIQTTLHIDRTVEKMYQLYAELAYSLTCPYGSG